MRAATRKVVYGLLVTGALAAFAVIYWWIDAIGLLLGIVDATAAVIIVTGFRAASSRTVFTFGYHAGYHGANGEPCLGPSCPVLEIAEARVAQLYRVSA